MNRYVLSYTSKIEHLRKGMLSPNEFIVFDALIHAAGWHPERPDYARVTKNVSQLHRVLFRDEETGYEVWTRQGVAKLIKSLIAKGYLVEEDGWFFLPNYEKWQRHGGDAQRTLASRTKKIATPVAPKVKNAQQSATPVADSLVDQTQEIATPVAGVQPRLQEGATPVAKIATPVAGGATPVADRGAETRATSESPDPSFMIHSTFTSPCPPTPQGGDAGAAEGEFEKALSDLEELFSQELQVIHLRAADFRHLRRFAERQIPISLIREVIADKKRAFVPSYPGESIRTVGFFVSEIEKRFATLSSPAPTGETSEVVPTTQAAPLAKKRSHAYEAARLSYYAQRVAKEYPSWDGAKGVENKRLREGSYDADFHRLIRSEAAVLARKVAECPPSQRRYYELQHPLAALVSELDEHEGCEPQGGVA